MRPHLLRFQGIGPYPDLVEIDFDQLTPLGLYLIVGPTGAGKSTIFDALSFALYGDVPSDRSIVSDHEHRQSPMIELEFSHRDTRYLVHREPGLPATATRKATNPKPNAQRFTKFSDSGAEELTVTGTKDVTKHVEELLGLTIDQFNRVILIPQNEFQEFLLASDKDKSDILDALFGTEIYKTFADKLWDEANKLRARAEQAEVALDQKYANIDAAVESLTKQELIEDAVDSRDDLTGLIAQITLLFQEAENAAAEAAEALASASAAKAVAASEADRFDAFYELKKFQAQHDEDAPRVVSAQSELDHHQQARQVLAAETEANLAQESLNTAEADVVHVRGALIDLVSSHDSAVFGAFMSAFESATPAQLAAELTKVTNLIDQAAKLFEAVANDRIDVQIATDASKDAANKLADLRAQQATLQADIEALRATEENAVNALKNQPTLKEKVDALDALLQRADVAGATAALVAAETERGLTGAAFQTANDALTQARKLQSLHMAGELARDLLPETACPVCGSTEHPVLAQPAEGASTEDLQVAYDAANNANALAEQAVREAATNLAAAQAEFAKLPSTDEQSALRQELSRVSDLAASAGKLQSDIKKRESALATVGTEITTQTGKVGQAETDITRLTKQIEASLQEAAKIMSEEALDIVQPIVAQATGLIDDLLKASDKVTNLVGVASVKKQNLHDLLKSTGFADCEAARFAIAVDERLSEIQELISEFAQLEISITGLKGKVGDQPVAASRPNLDDAEATLQQAHERHQTLSATSNAYGQNLKIILTAQSEIETLGPETRELVQNSKDA